MLTVVDCVLGLGEFIALFWSETFSHGVTLQGDFNLLTLRSFTMASSSQSTYGIQTSRIKRLRDPAKQPVVLVACGSFSPITFAHMRMFEMAQDYCRQNTNFEVVAGYVSPVGDGYRKLGLVSASMRWVLALVAPRPS